MSIGKLYGSSRRIQQLERRLIRLEGVVLLWAAMTSQQVNDGTLTEDQRTQMTALLQNGLREISQEINEHAH